MKRLFVGFELSEEAREKVVAVQDRLREVATRQGVRFVRHEKIHLTLVFLGQQAEDSIEAIERTVSDVCARHRPLNLTLQHLGGFPGLVRPKVLWCGVEGEVQELQSLQNDLATALGPFAEPEAKAYAPHLTLARISPGSKEVGRLAGQIALELGTGEIVRWNPDHCTLFESTPDGRYEVLNRWPLRTD